MLNKYAYLRFRFNSKFLINISPTFKENLSDILKY